MEKSIEDLTYKEKLAIAGVEFIVVKKAVKLGVSYNSYFFKHGGKTIEACNISYDQVDKPGCSIYYYVKEHFGIDNKILLH